MFSDETEQNLVFLIKREHDNNAFQILSRRYDNLLKSISWNWIRRYPYLPLDFDDLYNYSLYSFLVLTIKYDEQNKKSYPQYMKTFLNYYLSNYIKKFLTQNNYLMNHLVVVDNENISLKDIENDYQIEEIIQLISSFNFLTSLEKNTLLLFICNSFSPNEIAILLNKTVTSIYATISRGKKKIDRFYKTKSNFQ